MTPLNENFTSALNYPLHNFCCKKPQQHYTGITTATHSLWLQNKHLYRIVFVISHSNSQNLLQYPCMTSYAQCIPDSSSTFSVQMSIKIHLLYWGIPVKHHITVKVSNHLNHTDFSKNIQLCASCQIISSRTVLSLWKWVPTVARLMVWPDQNCRLTLMKSITHVLKDKHDNRFYSKFSWIIWPWYNSFVQSK